MRLSLLVPLLLAASSCYVSAQELLTNETVVKLSKAQISEGVILQLVRTQPGQYDITPDALVSLKEAGVQDGVIAAILNRTNSAAHVPQYHPPQTSVPSSAAPLPAAAVAFSLSNVPDAGQGRVYRFRSGSRSLLLEDATPVTLRITTAASSQNAKLGDAVNFQVARAVIVDGVVIIPRGARATGTIAAVKHKAHMGRGGSLQLSVDSVSLPDGREVPLRASRERYQSSGSQSGNIAVGGGTRWVAAPFIVVQGKDAVISHGTEISGYVDGDFNVAD